MAVNRFIKNITGNAATVTNGIYDTSNRIAKAWVNFDGTLTGTITPRANFNVSSVTKVSTGTFTINLTSAMADKNYTSFISTSNDLSAASFVYENSTYAARLTTSVAIQIAYLNAGAPTAADRSLVNVLIAGN